MLRIGETMVNHPSDKVLCWRFSITCARGGLSLFVRQLTVVPYWTAVTTVRLLDEVVYWYANFAMHLSEFQTWRFNITPLQNRAICPRKKLMYSEILNRGVKTENCKIWIVSFCLRSRSMYRRSVWRIRYWPPEFHIRENQHDSENSALKCCLGRFLKLGRYLKHFTIIVCTTFAEKLSKKRNENCSLICLVCPFLLYTIEQAPLTSAWLAGRVWCCFSSLVILFDMCSLFALRI